MFTDGVANDEEQVPAASKAWADHGVTVFAIGINDQISDQGLLDIAGDEERAFRVNDFAAISQLAKPLLKEICAEVLPTTTPGTALVGLTEILRTFLNTARIADF